MTRTFAEALGAVSRRRLSHHSNLPLPVEKRPPEKRLFRQTPHPYTLRQSAIYGPRSFAVVKLPTWNSLFPVRIEQCPVVRFRRLLSTELSLLLLLLLLFFLFLMTFI